MKYRDSLFIAIVLFCSSTLAHAEMVNGESIGNDPKLVKLCIERAHEGKPVPFEIDFRFVKSERSQHPDATFVAMENSDVECYAGGQDGKFQVAMLGGYSGLWHRIYLGPKRFEPGIETDAGRDMAIKACLGPAEAKINKPNFDSHSVGSVSEVLQATLKTKQRRLYAGPSAEPYDIEVDATSFYKTSGPDLSAVRFRCLFSSMLELKHIEFLLEPHG